MIALGSDQAGYELKQVVMRHLEERGLLTKITEVIVPTL